jgi:DNA-binding NtrC family response regulator
MEKRFAPECLIVEDEPITRMVAADAIADIGITVHEAAGAAEAWDLISDNPDIAVLVTDVDLPGGSDGLVLAANVHHARPEVELVVTSGAEWLADKDLPDHGTFLPKPYRTNALVEIVEEKLAHAEEQKKKRVQRRDQQSREVEASQELLKANISEAERLVVESDRMLRRHQKEREDDDNNEM